MTTRSTLKPKVKRSHTIKRKLKSFWEKYWVLIVIFVAGLLIGNFVLLRFLL